MRREVPLIITFVIGILLIATYILQGPILGGEYTWAILNADITNWGVLVSAFAVGIAAVNLTRIHGSKITNQRPGFVNSIALIGTMVIFIAVGVFNKHFGTEGTRSLFQNMFDYILSPLGAAMFAIIAFYVASASYRAFRARSTEAKMLLVAAILMMLASAPIGALIWNKFPVIGKWLLDVVNMAGQRGIRLGVAIGGFAASMRILLGIDRGHLGSE